MNNFYDLRKSSKDLKVGIYFDESIPDNDVDVKDEEFDLKES